MAIRYEVLMLTRPDVTQEETSNLEKQLSALVVNGKGSILSFEKWGKYKLSYPVKKNEYGVYVLARFELPKDAVTDLLKELQLFFRIKVNDVVVRHVSKKLAEDASLTYKKPESFEGGQRPYAPRGRGEGRPPFDSTDSRPSDSRPSVVEEKPQEKAASEEVTEPTPEA